MLLENKMPRKGWKVPMINKTTYIKNNNEVKLPVHMKSTDVLQLVTRITTPKPLNEKDVINVLTGIKSELDAFENAIEESEAKFWDYVNARIGDGDL